MPDYVDTARKAIDEQLGHLRDEIKRLEAAAAALGGARPGRRRGPGRPRATGSGTVHTQATGGTGTAADPIRSFSTYTGTVTLH